MLWFLLGRRSGYRRARGRRSGCATVFLWAFFIALIPASFQMGQWWLGVIVAVLLLLAIIGTVSKYLESRAHASTVAGYYGLTPEHFEAAVADLLKRLGWSSMRVVGQTGDLGVDVLARDPHGRLAAIQCKRWQPGSQVGSPVVQQLLGSVQIYHADRGLIFTTAGFTPAAVDLARQMDVELVDGARLAQLDQQAQRRAA